jgi:hypothetical protein
MEDPKAARRRAFVRNRRVPVRDVDESTRDTSPRPVIDNDEKTRRELYETRRRALVTESHPLDDDTVRAMILNGAHFSAILEEFRRSARVNSRTNTKAYNEPISFIVGTRVYGTDNEAFDFMCYELLKLGVDEVALVADGIRLYFRRNGKGSALRWILERKQPEGDGSGKSARYRRLGHGPGRSE